MANKLKGARFRHLNELLYTTHSSAAYSHFSTKPADFDAYHAGFREQVEKWPQNPVDRCIAFVRRMKGSPVVGDFGCGEGKLGATVSNTVHSFDLVAAHDHIVACDMRRVPLADAALDVAIFSLSLMGPNYLDFLREARRTLKPDTGVLVVAEVRSRLAGEGKGPEAERRGLDRFTQQCRHLGFDLRRKDTSNTMFVWLEFTRTARPVDEDGLSATGLSLKPCLYKRR